MNRYFLPSDQWSSDRLVLQGEEAKHCQQIMRVKLGESVELFDGAGTSAVARVIELNKREVVTEIVEKKNHAKPEVEMVLAQAIPKGKNMDLIIQKAVELGVSKIIPLITDNTVVKVEKHEKKQEKWQRVALEACKQCGQNWLPEVSCATAFDDYVSGNASNLVGEKRLRLAGAILPEAISLKEALSIDFNSGAVELLVGPEGDFSPEEYLQIKSAFVPVSLGELILRSETAAIFMISAAKAHFMS